MEFIEYAVPANLVALGIFVYLYFITDKTIWDAKWYFLAIVVGMNFYLYEEFKEKQWFDEFMASPCVAYAYTSPVVNPVTKEIIAEPQKYCAKRAIER